MTKLKQKIKERGLLIGYVAEQLGISRQMFSRIINMKEVPSKKLVDHICKFFEDTEANLFSDWPLKFRKEWQQ